MRCYFLSSSSQDHSKTVLNNDIFCKPPPCLVWHWSSCSSSITTRYKLPAALHTSSVWKHPSQIHFLLLEFSHCGLGAVLSEAASEKFHCSRDADGETVSLTDNLSLISLWVNFFRHFSGSKCSNLPCIRIWKLTRSCYKNGWKLFVRSVRNIVFYCHKLSWNKSVLWVKLLDSVATITAWKMSRHRDKTCAEKCPDFESTVSGLLPQIRLQKAPKSSQKYLI